jgi:hypothetical protein
MKSGKRTKYVREGRYVAEVDVELLEDDTGWSAYLSVQDACRLDDVRDALRRGDISRASDLARVFKLEPVNALRGARAAVLPGLQSRLEVTAWTKATRPW